jgi:hypothetical protein
MLTRYRFLVPEDDDNLTCDHDDYVNIMGQKITMILMTISLEDG